MVLLVVAGLAVSGILTYSSLRKAEFQRVDQQLTELAHPAGETLKHLQLDGGGGLPPFTTLPTGTYVAFVDTSGKAVAWLITRPYGEPAPPHPVLPSGMGSIDPGEDGAKYTTGAVDGSALRYRLMAQSASQVDPDLGPYTLVVAVPLTDVERTLHQLLVIEVLVAVGVALALGLVSWWLVRREMRPLERMGETAGAIAQGDLTRRVTPQDSRTEVGRLGLALNAMLAQIEQAFAERKASEDRLRRFLADASHELRTPLTSIRGYAELFRRGARERTDDLEKSMRRIEDESARMGLMVEDLLLLARLDASRALDRVPVDVAAIAADAVADARVADPDRPIELVAPSPVMATADEARLRQVAANLLSNAIRHTPPGTPVTVRVEARDGRAVLQVADRGPGLPHADAARVFEPFFRADPSRDRATGGAGLGLSIVQAIAEAHTGHVAVSETPGGGATFTVAIPLEEPVEEDEQETERGVRSTVDGHESVPPESPPSSFTPSPASSPAPSHVAPPT